MSATERDTWVADPGLAWQILLEADLDAPPEPDVLQQRLDELNTRLGSPSVPLLTGTDVGAVREALAGGLDTALAAGLVGHCLIVAAHHHHVDGLGLLAVLTALTGQPASSGARGVGARPMAASAWGSRWRRLAEVAFAPPARIVGTSHDPAASEDVFADLWLDRAIRPAELVHAAAMAAVVFNGRHGARTRRTTIAVGVSRTGGESADIAEHSALLRLRDLDGATRDEVRRRLREAPTEPQPVPRGSSPLVARATLLALRVLAPRLGSTLLVSHLGEVEAPDLTGLAFHPVTGGGSGVSIGAVGLAGRTRLTARARGARQSPPAMAELLRDVRDALG